MDNQYICSCTFQINLPNGDIDFITVFDLPPHIAIKFVRLNYPGMDLQFIEYVFFFDETSGKTG